MALQVNIHEAKTHLSRLLARVREGEEITIAKAGKPIARLVPVGERPVQRLPGSARGKVTIAPDFDAPLPESALAEFERLDYYWIPTRFCGGSPMTPACLEKLAGSSATERTNYSSAQPAVGRWPSTLLRACPSR